MAEAENQPSSEREVKLSAAPGFNLPDLNLVAEGVTAGSEQEARLETAYWDTADLRLARWGVSLRHRVRAGWTLKLAGSASDGLLVRPELHFSGPARTVPPRALDLLRGYLRSGELRPVARLSTWRRRVLLERAGQPLAEVVDDEVSVLDGRRVAARFREVEVELFAGGDEVLPSLLARLRTAGAGQPDPTPKHVRALGPAAQRPPEAAPPELGPKPTAGEVVRRALADAVTLVLSHDLGIRLAGQPEDVHQARVGTRRLRSHLRTFRPLLDRDWAAALRDELAWAAGELGAVRDQEVLLERLQGHLDLLPAEDRRAGESICARLAATAEESRTALRTTLAGKRYAELLERLVAAADSPQLQGEHESPAAQVLPPLARKPWAELRAAMQKLEPKSADEDLHACRILAKRARYAAEAVAPAAGPAAERFARATAALQTVLGEHQDCVTASLWLRSHAGAGRRAFAAGELAARELVEAEKARTGWPKVWQRLDRPKLRAWLKA
ncbi:MAG: CYTH and CHAD domain-containing protein [Candidatus Dormibacteraeota bacterium]|nr:CYTH and CHAD domain-containing protein [Candidatus Dormibacteraeota bacterium]